MKCAVSSLTCPAPLIHPAGVCVWWPGPAQAAQAPGSVSSFREIFSPVAAWRRWSCDWLSWHAAAPPADADIPWLGAVVIHTPDPGPCPCRDGVITISLHANPERLWHERLIILMLYLSQNLLDDRVWVNSKIANTKCFPALCEYCYYSKPNFREFLDWLLIYFILTQRISYYWTCIYS